MPQIPCPSVQTTITTPAGTTPAGTTPAGTTPAGTTPAGRTPAERRLQPDSAAQCTARSIRRDLLTLAGLPGHDRVRSTYLGAVGPKGTTISAPIAA